MASDDTSGGKPAGPVVLRIKLRYDDVDTMVQRFAPNVGKSGLFLPTKSIQPLGTEVKFELRISNDTPVLVGLGRVKAFREPDPANPRAAFGMAIELMRVSREGRDIIIRMIERRRAMGLADVAIPMPEDVETAKRADIETQPRVDSGATVRSPMPERDSTPNPIETRAGQLFAATDRPPERKSSPNEQLLTAPRPSSGPLAMRKGVERNSAPVLAPEPQRAKRPRVADLIAKASTGSAATATTVPGLDEHVDVERALARARALAGGDVDSELAALRESHAAPLVEITIEAASAELARQLGGAAVKRDRSARWAPPPAVETPSPPSGDAAATAKSTDEGESSSSKRGNRRRGTSRGSKPKLTGAPATVADAPADNAGDSAATSEPASTADATAADAAKSAAAPDAAKGSASTADDSVSTAAPDAAKAAAPAPAARVGAPTRAGTVDADAEREWARGAAREAARQIDDLNTPEAPQAAVTFVDAPIDEPAPFKRPATSSSEMDQLAAEAAIAAMARQGSGAQVIVRADEAPPEPVVPSHLAAANRATARASSSPASTAEAAAVQAAAMAPVPTAAPSTGGHTPAMLIDDDADLSSFERALDAARIQTGVTHTPAPPASFDDDEDIAELDESDIEELPGESTHIGDAPEIGAAALADRLDQHLDAAEAEANADFPAGTMDDPQAAPAEEFDEEEISDLDVLAVADADDDDLLQANGEREASNSHDAAPAYPEPVDPRIDVAPPPDYQAQPYEQLPDPQQLPDETPAFELPYHDDAYAQANDFDNPHYAPAGEPAQGYPPDEHAPHDYAQQAFAPPPYVPPQYTPEQHAHPQQDYDFAAQLDLGDDENPQPPAFTDYDRNLGELPKNASRGHQLGQYDPDYDDSRSSSYTFAENFPNAANTPGGATFDDPRGFGEGEDFDEPHQFSAHTPPGNNRRHYPSTAPATAQQRFQPPGYAGESFDDPHAFSGGNEPAILRAPERPSRPAEDVDLENALSTLDVDLDALEVPRDHREPSQRSASRPLPGMPPEREVPTVKPGERGPSKRLKRSVTEDEGVLIDFDDDDE